jgi:hypothetical protein
MLTVDGKVVSVYKVSTSGLALCSARSRVRKTQH